jgi:hypothetical protein
MDFIIMSDDVKKNASVPTRGRAIDRSVRTSVRNARVKSNKSHEKKTETNAPNKHDIDDNQLINNEEQSENYPHSNVSENDIAEEKHDVSSDDNTTLVKQDKPLKERKTSRSVLKERQLANRKNRRERQEKRKKELLESAIQKLKTYHGDDDALKNLEHSIGLNSGDVDSQASQIETSLSEKDILNDGTQKKPTQSVPPKQQSAKDRFRNAIKGIVAKNAPKENLTLQIHQEYLQSSIFKQKIEERKRIKKMVTQYLEEMGMKHVNHDFQSLSNQLTDILLLNIEITLPKYKNRVTKLQKRAELPVRSANNQLAYRKKSKTEAIVGDLFAQYPINKNDDKIKVNRYQKGDSLKIPQSNFDDIREDLLTYLLFEKPQNSSYFDNLQEEKPDTEYSSDNSIHPNLERESRELEKESFKDKLHTYTQNMLSQSDKEALLTPSQENAHAQKIYNESKQAPVSGMLKNQVKNFSVGTFSTLAATKGVDVLKARLNTVLAKHRAM